jgi:hypothetical protein
MKIKISITLLLLISLSGCDKISTNESKRFQIVFNPNARADTFLLDTQKGKVWQLTKITDVETQPTVWEPMSIIDPEGDIGITPKVFLERYPLEKKK